jgi:PAS domain S-box-containing protein
VDFLQLAATADEISILLHKSSGLRFRGQWIKSNNLNALIFLGAPWIQRVDELKSHLSFFTDFAIHDPTFDLLHIVKNIEINSEEAQILRRKLQEKSEQLRQSEEIYRATLLHASDVIYKTTEAGTLTFANHAAERVTGYSINELLQMNLLELIRSDMRAQVQEVLTNQIKEQMASVYLEFPIITKTGQEIWIGQSTKCSNGHDGQAFEALAMDISERKRIQSDLEATNNKLHLLQNLIDHSSEAIQIVDASGQLFYINEVASERLGIRREDCQKYNVSHFEVLFQDPANWLRHLEDLRQTDRMTIESFNVNQTTGATFPVEVTLNLLNIDDKQFVIANSRDITERKNNEQLLHQELKLQEISIDIASTFINLDLNDVEATINESLKKMGLFVRADRAYLFDYDFTHGTTSNTHEWCNVGINPEIQNLQHVPLDLFPQWVSQHQKGEAFYIANVSEMDDWDDAGLRAVLEPQGIKSLIAIPLFEGNQLIGFVGFDSVLELHQYSEKETKLLFLFGQMVINIRNRQGRERQLIIQDEKFRNIIAHMNLGLLEVNNEDIVQFANQSFCDMSGFSLKELQGKKASDLLVPVQRRNVIEQQQLAREAGSTESYELQVFNRSGEERRWLISDTANYDDKNQMIGTIGIYLDITNQKILEKELADAKTFAETASKAKELFLANMSHEIRTPLNVIIGMIRQLNKVDLRLEQVNYVQQAGSAAKHLLTIINNVLDMAKIDSGELEVVKAPFQLDKLAEHVYSFMNAQASEKNIAFNLKIGQHILPHLKGDETRIRQVLINLLGNAIKFTNQGQIDLDIRLMEEWDVYQKIQFKVTDTGVGMSPEFVSRIFDKFSQEQAAANRGFEGTGLGMAISNDLVTLMGGKMEVDSIKGIGTTVKFTIDFEADGLHVKEAPLKNVEKGDFEGRSALIVEDNEMNRFIARQSLEYLGFDLDEAENGQIAVNKVQEQTYDLILMDIQMPEMDGVQATRIMRQKLNISTPIIALTANAVRHDIDLYLAEGMNDFVIKPYEEEDLFHKIQLVFKHAQQKVTTAIAQNTSVESTSIYNLDFVVKLSRGNPRITRDMKLLFVETTTNQLIKLNEALKQEQKLEIAKIAHQIKPSLEQMKVDSILDYIKALEKLKTEDLPIATIQDYVKDIVATLEWIVVDIKKLV